MPASRLPCQLFIRLMLISLVAHVVLLRSQTANLRPDSQAPEDPKVRAEAVRLLELANLASTPTSATNMRFVTRFHLANPGPGELSDGEHIVTVGPSRKLRRNEWIIGSTHTILVRNGDQRQMLTPWAPLPSTAELIENITPIELAFFDARDVIHSIVDGPNNTACINFDSVTGERQQPGQICIDRQNYWLVSKKVGDTLTINSAFVPFGSAYIPSHIERSEAGALRFTFDQTVTPMTDFPPDFFAVAADSRFKSIDAACRDFRPPRPLYAPQPEPVSSSPVVTDIRIQATVQPDGHVSKAKPVENIYPDLNQQAVQTVLGWTFTPPYCDGKSLTSGITVTVEFKGR